MLSRVAQTAALSAARPILSRRLAAPSAVAVSSLSPWIRGMAKDNRPKFNPPRRPNDQSSQRAPQTSPTSGNSVPPSQKQEPPLGSSKAATDASQGEQTEGRNVGEADKNKAAYEQQSESDNPPFHSLPDLTQGIPSTLEYETSGATDRTALASISAASGGGRSKGELPASAYVSSSERRRKRLAAWMLGSVAAFTVGGVVYLGRNWDEDEIARHPDVLNGWGLGLWWNRSRTRMKEWTTYYQEPAFEKLLPDPDPSFARPYTLCISLEDMLVHSEWSRDHGWRVAKRPGMDYFLRYLSQYYELVLFTTVPFSFGEPLVRKLDPFRIIMWPLFREATKYKDGEVVKDLSYLNRDLSKVIIVDTNASHVRAQPENAIILPKWTGDPKDTDLVDLIPFLEYISVMQYGDVRKVLKSFEGKEIPAEFARREAIARAEFQKQVAGKAGKSTKKHASGLGSLGSVLGLKPSTVNMVPAPDGEQNASEAFAQGKMIQDLARERGQKNYEFLEKEIRENGANWLKEEAALMERANKEAMTSMMSSFTGWFVPGDAPAEGGDKPAAKDDAESPKKD